MDPNELNSSALVELDFSPQVPLCMPFNTLDDIAETVRKADNMLGAMLKGGSIAKATRHPKVERSLDPEAYAESLMDKKYELAIYRVWKLGVRLRDVDWASYANKPPRTGTGTKKYIHLATDLCTMYRRNDITADQAYTWWQHHRALTPLLNAISRVRKVNLDICCGVEGRDPRLFVELQAVNEQKTALNRCIHVATNGKRGTWQFLLDDDGWATLRATVDAFAERQQWLRAQVSSSITQPLTPYMPFDHLPTNEVSSQSPSSWNIPAEAFTMPQIPRTPTNTLAASPAQSYAQDCPPGQFISPIAQQQHW